MDAIRIEGLAKSYGDRTAVDGISLAIPSGSVFGFVGENGAGKTTTIRILTGFLKPDRGRAEVLGSSVLKEGPSILRDLGYLPGDLRLPRWMTGRNALTTFGRARGVDLGPRGGELAERFDLDLSIRVRSMSRGMRQKLGLILALAHDPRILVLDEPSTGLDPVQQDRLHGLLRDFAKGGGTVFFSSHVLSEVDGLCDRVAILDRGRIRADETIEALRARASRRLTIRFSEPPGSDLVPPPCVRMVRARGNEWEARLTGPVPALLEWLEGKPVADLTLGPPDLDHLFREVHRDGGGAS